MLPTVASYLERLPGGINAARHLPALGFLGL